MEFMGTNVSQADLHIKKNSLMDVGFPLIHVIMFNIQGDVQYIVTQLMVHSYEVLKSS